MNTLENITPLVDDILYYSSLYTGYTFKDGYFDSVELDKSNTLILFDHDGMGAVSWNLNDEADRSDLMTRSFMWYDIVPRAKLSKCEF
jgi:hypothetical protein